MQLKDLAAALGISAAMVSKLKKRGMPTASVPAAEKWRRRHLEPARTKGVRAGSERDASGLVAPAVGGVAAVATDLVDQAASAPPPEVERSERPASAPAADNGYSAARARREQADADVAEMTARKMRGELVSWEDVARGGFEVGRDLRDTMDAAVNALAAELAALSNAEQCAEVLRRHNRTVCDALVKAWREKIGPVPPGGLAA